VGGKTRVTYGVAAGDSLWSLSQRFDCSMSDLRNWNEVLERGAKRMRIGTSLTIWPGPKAQLAAKN
jgi:LysM repeat protein